MGNRSLDDFIGDDRTDTADTDARSDEVEPAVPTYVGRTGECAACGETVRRRWQSEDGLVCPGCKTW